MTSQGGNVIELASRRKPGRTIVTRLAIDPITTWTYAAVNSAIDAHETGQFADSAALADSMGRDDRIAACLNTRVNALLGRHGAEFSIEPSEEGDGRSRKALAREVEEWWIDAVPEKTARQILRDRILLGVSISRIEWKADGKRWIPRVRPWPMQFVYWDDAAGCYKAQAKEGVFDVRPGDPEWLIHSSSEDRPWMDGAIRSLGLAFLLRTFSWRDWARFSERHGMPIIAIKEPSDASEDDKKAFFSGLKNMGRGGILRLPQQPSIANEPGNGFDVSFIEARDTGWESFKAFGDALATSIAVYLLGQNLTTEVQGGSYAAATVHDRIRQDYLDADAEALSTDIRDGLLKPYVAFHYPASSVDVAPWPTWNTDAPEDRTELADTSLKAVQFIAAARTAGLRVDLDAYLERIGIPMLKGEAIDEAALEEAQERAQAIADGKPDEDEGDGENTPKDAPQAPESTSVRLASGDRVEDAPGFVSGQQYTDALGVNAARRASQAMRPSVDAILAAVQEATDPADLRRRLLETYRGLSDAELRDVTERAIILAELAGRAAVLEDL